MSSEPIMSFDARIQLLMRFLSHGVLLQFFWKMRNSDVWGEVWEKEIKPYTTIRKPYDDGSVDLVFESPEYEYFDPTNSTMDRDLMAFINHIMFSVDTVEKPYDMIDAAVNFVTYSSWSAYELATPKLNIDAKFDTNPVDKTKSLP